MNSPGCTHCHTDCLHGVGFSSKDGTGLAGVPWKEASVVTCYSGCYQFNLLHKRSCGTFSFLSHVLCGVIETMMKCPLSCALFCLRSGIVHSLTKQARAAFSRMTGIGMKHLGWVGQGRGGGCCSGAQHGSSSGAAAGDGSPPRSGVPDVLLWEKMLGSPSSENPPGGKGPEYVGR